MADDDLITLAEAAQIIGFSRRSLERWIQDWEKTPDDGQPRLPRAVRSPGGHRRYRRADAEAFRAALERAS